MWKRGFLFILIFLLGGSFALYFLFRGAPLTPSSFRVDWADAEEGSVATTDWPTLRGLDYKTGKKTSQVEALRDREVRIPGFMIPFEDNLELVSEFILVPDPLACIHVPPPPPNQMIYVRLKKAAKVDRKPLWVHGVLHIQSNDSPYGKVSFYMENAELRSFKEAH